MRTAFRRLLGNDDKPRGLWPIEWLALAYGVLTALVMTALWPDMSRPWEMLAGRLCILVGTLLMWRLWLLWPRRLMTFVRVTAQMVLLCYWYPDTYEFNRTFPNADHVFARCDAALFGCQPSLEFGRLCPWPWFSEAVNMGYFSYYPMILAVMVFFFLRRDGLYWKASFTVMCSFFVFYLVYVFLPVAGPQFYFQAVTPECVEGGMFPSLGARFDFRDAMLPSPGYVDGFFRHLVEWAQETGERPTAAFPSSHVGIAFILLYLVRPQSKGFFLALLPFTFLLTLATVYIQAHYLVDVIAGILVSYPVFRLSRWLYGRSACTLIMERTSPHELT